MTLLLQQLIDGIAWGSLYGALALTLVLVYRASGIINFAQAEFAMVGAFVAWQFTEWGLPVVMAIVIAMVLSFFGGAAAELVFVRPLSRTASHFTLIIITLGLMLVFNNGAGWVWDFSARGFPEIWPGPVINIGPAVISRQGFAIMAAAGVIAVVLYVLFQHTRIGLAMRASVGDPDSASLSGIAVANLTTISWGLAAVIGTLVASLAAPQLFLQPNMLATTLIYAFAAMILGGLNSPPGALVAGIIVGVVENLAGTYLPGIGGDFKQAIALLIIIGVLIVRPQGLFGKKEVVRV
ncbi:branched-chain amino acid transport system permease protein [Nocardioides daedukensis]|uniref:Branched-chain amino acid transport system permease protein n=1 Tax=Nocardioides daedukensis TaxID=634462 RepID=A0A7Y9S4U3_9ACTN|nr:branched-chain amino acid ABC transporter permease [Nocardioides daedukensis]NYG59754.1 branched-chain amino acid transport system permease protein [Nocardioides daedukensis]